MNITNSLIILAAISLATFILVLNTTTITTPMMTHVSAESREDGFEKEERDYLYYYPLEREEEYYPTPPLMNGYDVSELPEYIPAESYGDGYYDQYESGYYEAQRYGIPYDIE